MRSSLVLRGVLSLVVGLIAVAWPGITVEAFVILFAVYAFMHAGTEAMRAFRSGSAGPVAARLLLGALDIAAGVVALVWPGITVLALVLVISAWAFVTGIVEIALAFGARRTAGERAWYGLGGLISVALGIVLVIRPGVAALTLAEVYGFFSIVSGISALVLAAGPRDARHAAPATV